MNGKELYGRLRASQYLPNAFNEWEGYRDKVTDFIIKNSDSNKSIAILGAGRCNDIDLKKLKKHFYTITLIDRDKNSMQEALSKYDLLNDPNVDLQISDFVGITDEMYCDYADYMITELSKEGENTVINKVVPKILSKLKEIFNSVNSYDPQIGKQQYDYVASFGIHSQLLNIPIWIWSIGLANIKKTENSVEQMIKSENSRLIKRFNDEIIMLARNNVFLGCEMQRLGSYGGIEGAFQAIEDIRKRSENKLIDLKNVELTTWPFNELQNIIYQMCMINIKIK